MHDNSTTANPNDAITQIYAEEILSAFREQMQEAERLAGELHDLLGHYEAMIEREGHIGQVETLVRWAESYNSGLSAAGKISRDGQAWLCNLSHRMSPEVQEPEVTPAPAAPVKSSSKPESFFGGVARQVGKIPLHAKERSDGFFPVRRFRAQ